MWTSCGGAQPWLGVMDGGAIAERLLLKDRGWTVGEELRKEARSIHGASRLASRRGFNATKEGKGEGQRLGNKQMGWTGA